MPAVLLVTLNVKITEPAIFFKLHLILKLQSLLYFQSIKSKFNTHSAILPTYT